jgi:phosphohistidine phosphatase
LPDIVYITIKYEWGLLTFLLQSKRSNQTSLFMKIYVMRHGEAQVSAANDMQRALTPFGQEQSRASAQWLQSTYLGDRVIDRALVSPYLRTKQTFAELSATLKVSEVEYTKDIIPSGIVTLAHDYLDTCLDATPNTQNVLLVSHMPFVSYFVDVLCGRSDSPLFATGAIAVIEYDIASKQGILEAHFQG